MLGISSIARADDEIPHTKTAVQSVVAFKNGFGFVVKTGKAQLKDNWTIIEGIPPASLGSVSISAGDPASTVEEIISYVKHTTEVEVPKNFDELLQSYQSKELLIETGQGKIKGTILAIPPDTKEENLSSSVSSIAASSTTSFLNPITTPSVHLPSQLIALRIKDESGEKTLWINKASINSISVPGQEPLPQLNKEKNIGAVKVRFKGKDKSPDLILRYLEPGIAWIPNYFIDLTNEKTASLSLEAVLINEIEDLNNIEASFAVGTPNFQFETVVDPLFIGQTLTQLSQQISAMNTRQATNASSFLAQQTFSNSNYQAEGNRLAPFPTLTDGNDAQGDRNEDLFFYHQDHITLKRGERSRHTILSEKVSYESIYELKPPDPMEVDEYGNRRTREQEKKDFIPVWHAMRLENLGKNPWTTGVAFVTKNGLPLAEDTMPHTLTGEKGIVRLALARGLVAEEQLTEISRQQVNILQTNYFRVAVEGKIRIRNSQQVSAKLCISKSLVGEIKNMSDQGKSIKVLKRLNSINPTSELSWELVLDPKAEKELQYTYEVVLR